MEIFSDVIHSKMGSQEAHIESKGLYKRYEDKFAKHPGWEKHNHSLSDPTFKSNILKDENCIQIFKMIGDNLLEYLKELGHSEDTVTGFDVIESWLTHTVNGESARTHNHGSVDIAGVYYIQSNPDTDGNIFFLAPETIRTAHPLYGCLDNQFDVSPKENLMILFPGWMPHGTRIHNGEDPRISLSFNIKLGYK